MEPLTKNSPLKGHKLKKSCELCSERLILSNAHEKLYPVHQKPVFRTGVVLNNVFLSRCVFPYLKPVLSLLNSGADRYL